MTLKDLEVRLEARDTEIAEIKKQLHHNQIVTESLRDDLQRSNEEHKSSLAHMFQMIMAIFDNLDKGESSKANHII